MAHVDRRAMGGDPKVYNNYDGMSQFDTVCIGTNISGQLTGYVFSAPPSTMT